VDVGHRPNHVKSLVYFILLFLILFLLGFRFLSVKKWEVLVFADTGTYSRSQKCCVFGPGLFFNFQCYATQTSPKIQQNSNPNIYQESNHQWPKILWSQPLFCSSSSLSLSLSPISKTYACHLF
jgi:hypothetical protein